MVGILSLLFRAHQCCSGRAVMPISYIKVWNVGEFPCDHLDVISIGNHPESMSEAINGSNEIIFRLLVGISANHPVENVIVGICEEDRLNVCIVHPDVLHPILLLVAPGKFMLLDTPMHVVVGMRSHHQSILCLIVHGLRIDIIVFFAVLHQPSLVLEFLEVFGSALIHLWVVFACTRLKVNFRLDDMI